MSNLGIGSTFIYNYGFYPCHAKMFKYPTWTIKVALVFSLIFSEISCILGRIYIINYPIISLSLFFHSHSSLHWRIFIFSTHGSQPIKCSLKSWIWVRVHSKDSVMEPSESCAPGMWCCYHHQENVLCVTAEFHGWPEEEQEKNFGVNSWWNTGPMSWFRFTNIMVQG